MPSDPSTGMTLGEKSTLTISRYGNHLDPSNIADLPSDYAYGDRGFPGVIPAGSTLVLYVPSLNIFAGIQSYLQLLTHVNSDVELKAINGRSA